MLYVMTKSGKYLGAANGSGERALRVAESIMRWQVDATHRAASIDECIILTKEEMIQRGWKQIPGRKTPLA